MDNASKALVMAGAILIAVMLISLGVLLFNRARDISNDATSGIDRQTITAYNNEWMNYEGEQKSASVVRSLIQAVNSQNNNAESSYKYGYIKLKTAVANAKIDLETAALTAPETYKSSDISDTQRYKIVVLDYKNTGGAVSLIGIYGPSKSTQGAAPTL